METNGVFFADKIMDLANLNAGALVFGQLLGQQIDWLVALFGLFFLWLCGTISYYLRKGGFNQ